MTVRVQLPSCPHEELGGGYTPSTVDAKSSNRPAHGTFVVPLTFQNIDDRPKIEAVAVFV